MPCRLHGLQNADRAGLGIDRDPRGVHIEGEGALIAELAAIGGQLAVGRQCGEADGARWSLDAVRPEPGVPDRRAGEARRALPHCARESEAGRVQCFAGHRDPRRGEGAGVVGHGIRVGMP